MKLEKEVRDAKTVLKQLKQLPLRSVGDIKRVILLFVLIIMFCRNYLMYLISFTRVVSELHLDIYFQTRDAEGRVETAQKNLRDAQDFVLKLNKSQYAG